LASALEDVEWLAPLPSRFTPRKDPATIAQENGSLPGLVWKGAENVAPTGIRSSLKVLMQKQKFLVIIELRQKQKLLALFGIM
jgi:hypothetical protein